MTSRMCQTCLGSGDCEDCAGDGVIYEDGYSEECENCAGSGYCPNCDGNGEIED